MTRVFVDTSGWGHLADPAQQFSGKASAIYNEARRFDPVNYVDPFRAVDAERADQECG